VVLCRRLLGIGPNPSTKDAELIAFRVCEYQPRRVTLLDIGPPSTEGNEKFDFCGLIDRMGLRMESVPACLPLGVIQKESGILSDVVRSRDREPRTDRRGTRGQWARPGRLVAAAQGRKIPTSPAHPVCGRSACPSVRGPQPVRSGDRRCRAGAIGRPRQPRGYYGGRGVSTLGRGA
jgi:hypothetical protein